MRHVLLAVVLLSSSIAGGAEIARLTPQTWDALVPQGKEVDSIYGDYVLRNDRIIAVIADPLPTRNANMTVRSVGGMVIDLTRCDAPNDQLSCYYANAMALRFTDPGTVKIAIDGQSRDPGPDLKASGERIAWSASAVSPSGLEVTTTYTLANGQDWLQADTVVRNPKTTVVTQAITDMIRADRTFEFGTDEATGMFWAHDEFFQQCYGVIVDGRKPVSTGARDNILRMLDENGTDTVKLGPEESVTIHRKLIAGANLLEVRGLAGQIAGQKLATVQIEASDKEGPVHGAKVVVSRDGKPLGSGRTLRDGTLTFLLAPGKISMAATAIGREPVTTDAQISGPNMEKVRMELPSCGYVVAEITNEQGQATPCKVAFHGKGGTASPDFGPDSSDTVVRNLCYSHNGIFRQEIGAGQYDVIISYGPEYDAVFTEITVKKGAETKLAARLRRVVDSAGWISSDFHSHSTPSGDNTSSQLGRVQNLLCEHVEFCPCTEHNRVDTYVPLLKKLGVEHLMATCSGMELTGQPLPINHQNAFPLVHKPRTQDGGGPVTDANPVVQIERLALWDGGSEKLVQENHPNLVQILTDKDEDGKFDGGFASMFGFMDVIEVHPLHTIFTPPTRGTDGKLTRNPIFHWMQLLNLGYRIPGVCNTDAHYNFHESGWLRNYLRSPTDDPAKVDTMEMVRASEKGHIVMSTGPFMEVTLTAKGAPSSKSTGIPGDDVIALDGTADLHVRVQCPNWFDINRVQVFANGRADKSLNFTRRESPRSFQDGVVKFDATIPLALKSDAHIIVSAIGEGLTLGPVMGEERGRQAPVAVSNPIFVDVDGQGFQANHDLLDVPLPK